MSQTETAKLLNTAMDQAIDAALMLAKTDKTRTVSHIGVDLRTHLKRKRLRCEIVDKFKQLCALSLVPYTQCTFTGEFNLRVDVMRCSLNYDQAVKFCEIYQLPKITKEAHSEYH